jgi:hypothetical protein
MNAINGFMSCWRVARCDTVLTDAGIRLRGGFAVQGRADRHQKPASDPKLLATRQRKEETRGEQINSKPPRAPPLLLLQSLRRPSLSLVGGGGWIRSNLFRTGRPTISLFFSGDEPAAIGAEQAWWQVRSCI